MGRLHRWIGGTIVVALGAGAFVLGPPFYKAVIKPATSDRWSDLSPAEREQRNRANDAAMKAKQDDAAWRAKLIAKGEDPAMDPVLNRDNPQRLREIAAKKAQALAEEMNAAQQRRENSPAEIAARQKRDDVRAERLAMIQTPDGDIVRMTPSEDAAAVAKIIKAFGGTSPFTPIDTMLRERHPWVLRFHNLDYLGQDGMKAVMSQSHPKSHFAIIHNMTNIEAGLVRPSIAAWVKGADGAVKIVFTSGFANRSSANFIAVGIRNGREVGRQTLKRVPGPRQAYVIDDMSFTSLMIYADTVSEATMIYALEVTQALAERDKFFAAY